MIKSTLIVACLGLFTASASAQSFQVSPKVSVPTKTEIRRAQLDETPAIDLMGSSQRKARKHPIWDTPDGTAYDYSLTTTYYDPEKDEFVTGSAIKTTVVIDGDDVYLQNIITSYPYDTWIKGTINEYRNAVVFENPQVYYEDLNGNLFYASLAYVDGNYDIHADTESDEFEMDWDDATGSFWSDDLEICVVNEDGGVFSYNWGYAYERFTDTLVVAPEGLEFKPYSLRYENAYKYYVPEMVYIARDGNDFYFKGMSTKTPDALVKGEMVGDSIYIASGQYVGLYNGQYYLYTKGAAYKGLDDNGYPIYTSKDYCVMAYNEAEDSFYGPDGFLITLGKARNASYSQSFPTQTIKRFYEVAATPATPDIRTWDVDMTYGIQTSMTYVVPVEDVEGNYINPDSLFYRFFVNGELFEFDRDWYPMFVDSVLVNSKFSDRGQTSRQRTDCDGSYHVIAFEHDFSLTVDSIALQSVYFMGGEVRYSDYCVYVTADGSKHTTPSGQTGIAAISCDNRQATAVKYFDLSGRQLVEPGKGICIKQTSFKDGTVQHQTIFR